MGRGRWGRGRAAGQTVLRTVSAGGARRPRRSRGGLRPGLAAFRGRRGRLPQGTGEAYGRVGKGKTGGEGGPQGAPAQPEPAAGGRRNRRRRFARRAVPPDGAAARNGLLRRKWQDWKVKGMFTSLYGKNVLQYIIGKLPEKITPPRAGSKEHRL